MVADPFMNSGSTYVAALLEGRRFIGVEHNEHWFAAAHICVDRNNEGMNHIKKMCARQDSNL